MIGRCAEEAARNNLGLETMVAAAQAFCPVDSGALLGSIRAERVGPLESVLAAGGLQYINPRTMRPVLYAEYVHEGTSTTPAHPFLLQALLLERQNLLQRILWDSGALMQ
jgi:hypothetical protein